MEPGRVMHTADAGRALLRYAGVAIDPLWPGLAAVGPALRPDLLRGPAGQVHSRFDLAGARPDGTRPRPRRPAPPVGRGTRDRHHGEPGHRFDGYCPDHPVRRWRPVSRAVVAARPRSDPGGIAQPARVVGVPAPDPGAEFEVEP